MKETFSLVVGCRLEWDRWTDRDTVVCSSMEQYREYEALYNSVSEEELGSIVRKTGCLSPCHYTEYRSEWTRVSVQCMSTV